MPQQIIVSDDQNKVLLDRGFTAQDFWDLCMKEPVAEISKKNDEVLLDAVKKADPSDTIGKVKDDVANKKVASQSAIDDIGVKTI